MSITLPAAVLEQYPNPCFIETGTYEGDGVQLALDCGFDEVHSFEVDPVLAERAKARFADQPNVKIHCGDSATLLRGVIETVRTPITFWLDAHAHGDDEALPRPTALLPELEAIAASGRTDGTVLIDDLRVICKREYWGNDVGGGVDGLLRALCRINPRYRFGFEDSEIAAGDILAAVPSADGRAYQRYRSGTLTSHTALRALEREVQRVRAVPTPDFRRPRYRDRGIVVPGGGEKYLPGVWVCVNMLRHLGCTLPIQVWHLGPDEMPEFMQQRLAALEAECVDALEVRASHPARILMGWEMKPYAMLHSPFREVLLLDADNVAVCDPTYLFDTGQYKRAGAVFWPDYHRAAEHKPIWDLTGVTYRDEPEFETGQVLIDKSKCWRELLLTMWFNEHSDFWYRHVLGDKDTFHFAWHKLGTEYAMPDTPIQKLEGTMCQHDFEGQRVFQHRNTAKWVLPMEANKRVAGFAGETVCRTWLSELDALGN